MLLMNMHRECWGRHWLIIAIYIILTQYWDAACRYYVRHFYILFGEKYVLLNDTI